MKNFSFLLIIVVCFSCNNAEEKRKITLSEYYLIDEVKIKLDDSTSNELLRVQFFEEDNNDFLLALNPIIHSIDKYSLENGELIKRIKFPSEGPEAINGAIQGFVYHNKDSIFIFPKGRLKGSIVLNENKEVVDILMPSKIETEKLGMVNHVSSTSNPSKIIGDELYFNRFPLFDLQNPANINDSYPFELSYSLTTKQFSFDSLSIYPMFYRNKIWSTFDLIYYRCFGEKDAKLYSWSLLGDLILIDEKKARIEIPAKSYFHKKDQKPFATIPSDEKEDEVSLTGLRYGEIIFDKYRSLYYRVAYLPFIDYNHEDFPRGRQGREFTVIILDKDFQFVKEVIFPKNTYKMFNAFVGPKGLCLPRNNIYYKDLDEDVVSIDIFNFNI